MKPLILFSILFLSTCLSVVLGSGQKKKQTKGKPKGVDTDSDDEDDFIDLGRIMDDKIDLQDVMEDKKLRQMILEKQQKKRDEQGAAAASKPGDPITVGELVEELNDPAIRERAIRASVRGRKARKEKEFGVVCNNIEPLRNLPLFSPGGHSPPGSRGPGGSPSFRHGFPHGDFPDYEEAIDWRPEGDSSSFGHGSQPMHFGGMGDQRMQLRLPTLKPQPPPKTKKGRAQGESESEKKETKQRKQGPRPPPKPLPEEKPGPRPKQ